MYFNGCNFRFYANISDNFRYNPQQHYKFDGGSVGVPSFGRLAAA